MTKRSNSTRSRAKRTASTRPAKATTALTAPPITRMMLQAGMHAFWELSRRWQLTPAEQRALFAVSERTRARWKTNLPINGKKTMDRHRIILLTYRRMLEIAGDVEADTVAFLRQSGSADNPESPKQSLLAALSARSLRTMDRHYRRLEALIHAS